MDLATARRIIADNSRAPHMADWMLAGRVLYDHWQRNPHLLKPATLTLDAKPKRRETMDELTQSLRALTADIRKLGRRKQTRDQDAKRLMQLPGHASVYRVTTDPDGRTWLIGEGAQTGKQPPAADPDLMEADPPLKMGPTEQEYGFGDAIARHKRSAAARAKGAAFAEAQNERMRKHWGQH
jgi:hypothetical protein